MKLWVFSSKTFENIERGYSVRKWAVSEAMQAQRYARSRNMQVDSCGVLYCSEDKTFTLPFRTLSLPEYKTVAGIWTEPWSFPFDIEPLGTPQRRVGLAVAVRTWRILEGAEDNPPAHLMGMNGMTVFIPNEIEEEDWKQILKDLGPRLE
jgi:hypothetical protein